MCVTKWQVLVYIIVWNVTKDTWLGSWEAHTCLLVSHPTRTNQHSDTHPYCNAKVAITATIIVLLLKHPFQLHFTGFSEQSRLYACIHQPLSTLCRERLHPRSERMRLVPAITGGISSAGIPKMFPLCHSELWFAFSQSQSIIFQLSKPVGPQEVLPWDLAKLRE
jgi:hypothetical protein